MRISSSVLHPHTHTGGVFVLPCANASRRPPRAPCKNEPANLPRPQILLVTARASLPSPAPCPGAHRLRSSVDRGVCSSALRGANARFAKCFPPAGLSVLVAREAEARKKSRVQCVVLAFGLGGRALTRRVTTRRSPPESSLFPFSLCMGFIPGRPGHAIP